MLIRFIQTIEKTVPEAVPGMSYGMPAYKFQSKPLVYFAANKKHLGFYPTSGVIAAFENDLKNYKFSKGAVQFPYDKKIPWPLVIKMIQYRATAIIEKIKE